MDSRFNIDVAPLINSEAVLNFMEKKFSESRSSSEIVVKRLNMILSDEPEKFLDSISLLLSGRSPFLTLLPKIFQLAAAGFIDKGIEPDPGTKVDILAAIWDAHHLFRLPATLLHKGSSIANSPDGVWSKFQAFGLKPKDVSVFRRLRNAKVHRIVHVGDNFYAADKYGNIDPLEINLKNLICSTSDVDQIYRKVEYIFSWWFTLIFVSMMHSPRFIVLFFMAFFQQDLSKDSLGNSLSYLYPKYLKRPQTFQKDRILHTVSSTVALQKITAYSVKLIEQQRLLAKQIQNSGKALKLLESADYCDKMISTIKLFLTNRMNGGTSVIEGH